MATEYILCLNFIIMYVSIEGQKLITELMFTVMYCHAVFK